MALSHSCPDGQELAHYSVGLMDEPGSARVEDHMHDCSDCMAKLESLKVNDTLTAAMRGQATLVDRPVVDDRVQTVMGAAKLLYSGVSTPPSEEESLDFLAPAQTAGDLGQLGSYRILKVLGRGGMGIVFMAEDTLLKRSVALKVLRPFLASVPAARQRFLREAQASAAALHDHLVPIHQVGEADGVPFLAMQLLEGESLEERWKREGKLLIGDVVSIGRQIAQGLAAAHAHGLVHRDIKPGNIWLESRGQESGGRGQGSVVRNQGSGIRSPGEGANALTPDSRSLTPVRVKILDFGLARAVADESNLTAPGVLLGTPAFMAPEQADGKEVDARADLFSLGCVLYSLCAGVKPFAGSTPLIVLRAVCDQEPQALRERNPAVPEWLAAVVTKLLAKKPGDRYQSAAEVVEALSQPQVVSPAKSPTTKRRSSRAWLATAAAILLAAVGLSITEATGVTHFLTSATPEEPKLPFRADLLKPIDSEKESGTRIVILPEEEPKPEPQKPAGKPVFPAALFVFEGKGSVADSGGKITDLLFAQLTARPELYLVDRADLKKTLAEQALNISGAVKPGEATAVGQLTGAKLLISGSVVQIDRKIYLIAKIIATETSRVTGVSVNGRDSDELGPLVTELADLVAEAIAKKGPDLVAKTVAKKERLAELKEQLKDKIRPSVWIQVSERHVGPSIDPAAQTEISLFCKETGFVIHDTEEGAPGKADVWIKGEGFSETAARLGGLYGVKARLELKAIDRKSGEVLAVDRQTVVMVDATEHIASKSALQEAAAILAERMLPKVTRPRPAKNERMAMVD